MNAIDANKTSYENKNLLVLLSLYPNLTPLSVLIVIAIFTRSN